MNEIVKTEPKPVLQAGGIISGIVPQNLDEAFRLSSAIHQAGMSPYGLDTPQKVMIAMLAGLELGMPPMQGVQSIAVINNRPCMWGDGLSGVVRTSKACLYVKEWTEGEGESRVAYCETKRRGEDEPVVRSFSVDDAKRAGLWQTSARVTKKRKDGGTYETANDSPWFKYPQRMLQMRARAWCLRDVYPDVLKGMQAREEVEDYPEAEGEVQPAKPTVLARLQAHREPPQIEARPREGFSPSFAADEAATLSSEPSASPADESGDAAALPSTVAASDPQEGGSSEEGDNPGTVATEQPAPSSGALSDDDRAWLVTAARTLVPSAAPNGDPDVVRRQYAGLLKSTPKDVSKAAIEQAVAICRRLVAVCEASEELDLDIIAGLAKCDVADLRARDEALREAR